MRERRQSLRIEIVREQIAELRLLVAPTFRRNFDRFKREARKQHAPADGYDVVIASFLDRKRDDTAGNAVEIDFDLRRFRFLTDLIVGMMLAMERRGLWDEGRGYVFAQRDREGTHRKRKAQIELKRIIDRIEIARRQKIQIVAVGIPSNVGVDTQRRSDVMLLARLYLTDANDPDVMRRRPRVRDEAPVRRKRQTRRYIARTLIDFPQRAFRAIEEKQLSPVVRKRHQIGRRG